MSDKKVCEQCGVGYTPKKWWSRFCGNSCRMKFHVQQRKEALYEFRLYRQQPERPQSAESAAALAIEKLHLLAGST